MPWIVPVLLVVGAAVSAYGAIQQGQATKKAAQFNATVANQNAEAARAQARAQQAQEQRTTFLRLGAIRAQAGASGGTEGSALDVLGDVAAQGEIQRQQIGFRGELEARGFKNTAALDLFQGKNAAKVANISAAGTVISAADGLAGGGFGGAGTSLVSQNAVPSATSGGRS